VCAGLEPGLSRTVTKVIDGETVALDDGSELRLVGALAPRAIDVGAEPGTWPMEVAAREELDALLLGKSVVIAFGGARADRYGRQQAQVLVTEAGGRRWVQGYLLEQGLARAYTLAGNRACAEELLAAERAAREARRGLWAEAAYQVRDADRAGELRRYLATFQVAEGRISRVGQARGTIYLNFAGERGRALTVSLRRGDAALLGAHARAPQTLEGARVRVRGWIEERRGPAIDLSAGGALEVLEARPPGLVETGRPR
jgi:endonuclease YncB( thermonuclease family)